MVRDILLNIKYLINDKANYICVLKLNNFIQKKIYNNKKNEELYTVIKKSISQEKYVIMRYRYPDSGLMAVAVQALFSYEYAKSKGYIPIYDIEYPDCASDINRLGEDNMWDYAFKQPISVKEALGKEHVIIEMMACPNAWLTKTCMEINGSKGDHWVHMKKENRKMYYKNAYKYAADVWKPSDSVVEIVNESFTARVDFASGDRVLAVTLREEFTQAAFDLMPPKRQQIYLHHPCNISVEETLELVKKKMRDWKCDKVLLCSIQQESIDLFEKELGDKLIYFDRKRITMEDYKLDLFDVPSEEIRQHKKNEGYDNFFKESTEPYLAEIIAAAKCNCFIGAKCSSSVGTLIYNAGEFEEFEFLPDSREIGFF